MADTEILNEAMALFGATPVAKSTPPKKSKSKDREEIDFGKDLDSLAALKTVADILYSTAESIEAELKQKAMEQFASTMFEKRARPDAFIGTGPRSSAYVQLRRKGSNSALDEMTVERLKAHEIHMARQVKVPGRLVINPDVLNNQELLGAISEALRDHPKLQGVQVVKVQPEEWYYSTSDETIPQLARAAKSEQEAAELLACVSGASIGSFQIDKLKDPTTLIDRALDIIIGAKLLAVPNETSSTPAAVPTAEVTTVAPAKQPALKEKVV